MAASVSSARCLTLASFDSRSCLIHCGARLRMVMIRVVVFASMPSLCGPRPFRATAKGITQIKPRPGQSCAAVLRAISSCVAPLPLGDAVQRPVAAPPAHQPQGRSEEHTSELQSLIRTSYPVFCLKKKHIKLHVTQHHTTTPPLHQV